MNITQKYDNAVRGASSFLDNNKIVSLLVGLSLVVYIVLVAPYLSLGTARMFGNPWFKLVLLAIVMFVAQISPALGILLAIAVITSIQSYHNARRSDEPVRNSPLVYEPATHMEERSMDQDIHLPDQILTELGSETKEDPDDGSCKEKYKNKFYPQYVNMDPESSYDARYNGHSVNGYDPNAGMYQTK